MDAQEPTAEGADWSDWQNDLLVADYFAMLAEEQAGRSYVKAQHRREIIRLTGRRDGAVERKYMNVSAVLDSLGMPRIRGYKSYDHAQFTGLTAAIERYLEANPVRLEVDIAAPTLPDNYDPFVERPLLLAKPPPEPIRRLVRKFDPVARDARNRALGQRGESFVFEQEKRRLVAARRDDLLPDLQWVSRDLGDGAGYDIRSFDPETGAERLIEVKSTYGDHNMPFYLSRNEDSLALERPAEFRLYRVFDLANRPRIFTIQPPLRDSVHLETANWQASFR